VSQATERVRDRAALASSPRALENHSSAGEDRKTTKRSGLVVVKNTRATNRTTSFATSGRLACGAGFQV
jgi:hypothetical protein